MAIYVSGSGDDSTADGTQSLPYRTPQAALDAVASTSESVLFNRGDEYFGDMSLPAYSGLTLGSYGSGALPKIYGEKSFLLNALDADAYFTYGQGKNIDSGDLKNGRFNSTTGWTVDQTGGTIESVTNHPAGTNAATAIKATRASGTLLRVAQTVYVAAGQKYELSFKVYTQNGGKMYVSNLSGTASLQDSETAGVYETWGAGTVTLSALTTSSDTGSWTTKSIVLKNTYNSSSTLVPVILRFNFDTSDLGGEVYLTDLMLRPIAENVSGNIWSMGWNVNASGTPVCFKDDTPLRQYTCGIVDISETGNPATITMKHRPHGVTPSGTFTVTIAGGTGGDSANYNGTHTATAVGVDQFTIPVAVSDNGTFSSATITSFEVNATVPFGLDTSYGNNGNIIYLYDTSDPTDSGYTSEYYTVSSVTTHTMLDCNGVASVTIEDIHLYGLSGGLYGALFDGTSPVLNRVTMQVSYRSAKIDTGATSAEVNNCTFTGTQNWHLQVAEDGAVIDGSSFAKATHNVTDGGGGVWWYDIDSVTVQNCVFDDLEQYGVAWQGGSAGVANSIIQRNEFTDVPVPVWDQSTAAKSSGNIVRLNYIHDLKAAVATFYTVNIELFSAGKSAAFLLYGAGNDTAINNNHVDGAEYFAVLNSAPDSQTFSENVIQNIGTAYTHVISSGSGLASITWTDNIYDSDGSWQWWDGATIDTDNYAWWSTTAGNSGEVGIDDPEINASLTTASTSPTVDTGSNAYDQDYFNNYIVGGPHLGAIWYVPNGDTSDRR